MVGPGLDALADARLTSISGGAVSTRTDFDELVAARSTRLLRTAYLVYRPE